MASADSDVHLLGFQRIDRQGHHQIARDGAQEAQGALRPWRGVVIRQQGQRPIIISVRPERRFQVVIVVRVFLKSPDGQAEEGRPHVLRPRGLSSFRKRLRPRRLCPRHVRHWKQIYVVQDLIAVSRDEHGRIRRLGLGKVPHTGHLGDRRPDGRRIYGTPHRLARIAVLSPALVLVVQRTRVVLALQKRERRGWAASESAVIVCRTATGPDTVTFTTHRDARTIRSRIPASLDAVDCIATR